MNLINNNNNIYQIYPINIITKTKILFIFHILNFK